MAGPDGSIMCQYVGVGGGAADTHPNLADPPQMLRSEETDIFGTSDPSRTFTLEDFSLNV